MDRPANELIESAIDLEIRTLLAQEPSQEFQARVRLCVATASARADWRSRWMFVTTGAIAAMILAGLVLSRPHPSSIHQLPGPVESVSPVLTTPPMTAGEDTTAARLSSPKRPKHATPRPEPVPLALLDRPVEPDVLVSAGETQALRRLLARAREDRIALSTAILPTTTEDISELVGIHPLVPVTIQEGVLQ